MGELVMYILVDEELKISKGKLAGQVGHAVASYFWRDDAGYSKIKNYMEGHQKKIILKCPREKLKELEKFGYVAIRDAGFTELEPNTLTCVNYGIIYKHEAPAWLENLKLY